MKEHTVDSHNFSWLDIPAEDAARRLLGCEILCEVGGQRVRVRIVETEAYDQTDEASHTHGGQTNRNAAMFMGAGHLYVYFTYGMHHCMNIVCGQSGFGSGVLLRAVEPLEGLDTIEQRRGKSGVVVTNGPGKLCQALGVDLRYSGHDLTMAPIRLIKQPALNDSEITTSYRVGISKAVHELRRFYITNNRYVSKK